MRGLGAFLNEVCVCTLMRYNPHTYAEGPAWLSLPQAASAGCALSDKRDSPGGRGARRKGSSEPCVSQIPSCRDRRQRKEAKKGGHQRDWKGSREGRGKLHSVLCTPVPALRSHFVHSRSIPFGAKQRTLKTDKSIRTCSRAGDTLCVCSCPIHLSIATYLCIIM